MVLIIWIIFLPLYLFFVDFTVEVCRSSHQYSPSSQSVSVPNSTSPSLGKYKIPKTNGDLRFLFFFLLIPLPYYYGYLVSIVPFTWPNHCKLVSTSLLVIDCIFLDIFVVFTLFSEVSRRHDLLIKSNSTVCIMSFLLSISGHISVP